MKKKLLSLALALCMVLAILPTAALAAAKPGDTTVSADLTYKLSQPIKRIAPVPDSVRNNPYIDRGAKFEGAYVVPAGTVITAYNSEGEQYGVSYIASDGIGETGELEVQAGFYYPIYDSGFIVFYGEDQTTAPTEPTTSPEPTTPPSDLGDFTIENGVLTKYTGKGGNVTIPGSVTKIGDFAFACTALTGVTIPNSVISIGENAFVECKSLTSVTIPGSVTGIGELAFNCCTSLTAIQVDAGNQAYTSVDGVLFTKDMKNLIAYPCAKKGTYTIPSGVTRIEKYAFDLCKGLTGVTIPASVTSIGDNGFFRSNLASVTIPSSVTSIGEGVFDNCNDLPAIQVDAGNPAYTSVDGVLFTKDMKTLKAYPCAKKGAYTIPSGVTAIDRNAFSTAGNLTSVTIPNGVTSIAESTFFGCDSLTSVVIPGSVTSIAHQAFSDCTGLTGVFIPDSVTSVWEDAFLRCTALRDVYYSGSEAQWKQIQLIDGFGAVSGGKKLQPEHFNNATIHYNSPMPDTPTTPSTSLPTVEQIPAAGTAVARPQTVKLDGRDVQFQYYAVKDAKGNESNYVKIRDLASALNGTKAQFDVGWDGKITITPNTAYKVVGGEGTTPYSGSQSYTAVSDIPVSFNGSSVKLTSFQIKDSAGNGYTYYKLRDLGQLLGFNVTWDGGVVIETDKPYSG